MLTETIEAINAHALADYPRESCGLVVTVNGDEVYWPCKNLAEGNDSFIMDKEDWAAAEDAGEIEAVVHSHPDADAKPSEADKMACEATQIPWVIVSVHEGQITGRTVTSPEGFKAPLVGRQFFHGFLDCYTLIQDWYSREAGITLPDFDREDGWWNKGKDLYLDGFQAAGFSALETGQIIKPGDVILMCIRAKTANHAGVYLDKLALKEHPDLHPVPNAMLHHMYGRQSERVVYGGFWLANTMLVIRHKDYKNVR